MTEERKAPKLRFPGFTDPWEQRKWNDTVDISTEMVNPTSGEFDNMPHIAPGNIESFTGRILDNVKTVKDEQLISGKFRFRPNDVVYGKINPQLGKYFFARTDGLTSADAYVLNGKNGITQEFLYSLLQTADFFKYSVSVSKRSGMPKINRDELNAYSFLAPSEEEQERIGRFLLNIDNLIALHQRKCDQVKALKKAMLQKMFPKEGETVPEIRFPGFTGPWEQRKFSDFTWNAGKRNSQNLDLEPYAVTNDRGFIRQNEAHDEFGYMKDVDRKAYNIVMPKSFAYNPARINVGSIGYYEGAENVVVSSLYEVFQTADYVDDRFLWHWFKSDMFPKWIERLQEGSVRLYFYYDKLCECKMFMPSLPEQKKVASTLDEIDNLIVLHQRKCDELKKLKKGLLQQMFV